MDMNDMSETITLKGHVFGQIEYKSGVVTHFDFPNTILKTGKRVLPITLTNQIGATFNMYVTKMLFGDGGTDGGVKKFVNSDRNGLFGVVQLSKPVIATIDTLLPTQAVFTSVVRYEDAVGLTLNEMGLQMSNGDLYSQVTFEDFTKTEDMQITYQWKIMVI